MPKIIVTPTEYSSEHIETERIFPLIDKKIESLLDRIHTKDIGSTIKLVDDSLSIVTDSYRTNINNQFKSKVEHYISNSRRNTIKGLERFKRSDIILGCSQYIDNLYVKYGSSNIQVLEGEYRYHYRMFPNMKPATIGNLDPNKHLIISAPFTNGSMHINFTEILNECLEKNISVHIDGAWITAAQNVRLNLSHPSIVSIGISLSKGYGLSGWNRVGVRWTNDTEPDTISLMNDFQQVHSLPIQIGTFMLNNLSVDHLWDTHESNYYKICSDFNLVPTDTIHVGLSNDYVHGISPLLRYLEYNV
jgi:antitoxin component YwqK of YwqJK toxin-antitoxin module